jgi:GR25 family glycosyltransferase involved in LPS biosynthesis
MSHNIDKIFYINLERRVDRREEIEKELNNMELKYERFCAIEHEIGLVGCGYSHLAILKLAKERKYKNVLIFEDDFTFLVSKTEFEKYIGDLFSKFNDNFDVCFLSYNCASFEDLPGLPFLKRTFDTQTASGYIVNETYYQKLIDLYEEAMPLLAETNFHWIYANDQVWKTLQKTDMWVRFDKKLGKQRPSFSDNSKCFADYDV